MVTPVGVSVKQSVYGSIGVSDQTMKHACANDPACANTLVTTTNIGDGEKMSNKLSNDS